jgi:hypothetical protein
MDVEHLLIEPREPKRNMTGRLLMDGLKLIFNVRRFSVKQDIAHRKKRFTSVTRTQRVEK